ncbi:MAG TPA: oxidoreductase [Nocardioidaceae bacterium]|nr:oxidoreductase [Nocardioidaceae bacterium]
MARDFGLLVLGGTSWLGGAVAAEAVGRGHDVTCLARGESGSVPEGARHVRADRWSSTAYGEVQMRAWDAVVDVSRQPDLVDSALAALASRSRHWVYVSSISVYADHSTPDADESAELVGPWTGSGEAGQEEYAGAKVSCETRCREAVDPHHLLIARAGLIVGYGDRSDRFGYWPGRFALAADGGPVLAPPADQPVQVIDVLDLAGWLVDSAEHGTAGTFDVVGDQLHFRDVASACVRASGLDPVLVQPGEAWLSDAGVSPWAGPESLPLWLPRGQYRGMVTRSGARARRAGLSCRSLFESVSDSLRWEEELGLVRTRLAGLTRAREQELLARVGVGC